MRPDTRSYVRDDSPIVTLWGRDKDSFENAIKLLKRRLSKSGVMKMLKQRKTEPSVNGRARAKRARAAAVRERNLKRQNKARLTKGARRR